MFAQKSDSVYNLISELCVKLVDEFRPYEVKNVTSVRQLRSKAYEILLKKSLNCAVDSEYDAIRDFDIAEFEMRIRAKHDPDLKIKCDRLFESYELLAQEGYWENTDGKDVLKFLLSLQDALQSIGDSSLYNMMDATVGPPQLLVPGPFTLYSEYSTSRHYPQTFIQSKKFTGEAFKKLQTLEDYNNPYLPRFFFSREPRKLPSIKSHINLSQKQDIFEKYGVPSVFRPFSRAIPSLSTIFHIHEIAPQEATSLSKTSASRCQEIIESKPQTLSWNWEFLGSNHVPINEPFASESGSILHLQGSFERALGGQFSTKLVNEERFLSDLKSLTIGIQSDTFSHDELMVFHMEPNVTIVGISPNVIEIFVTEFLECGTCYKRFQLMITKKNYKLLYDGFIFKALCSAIESYLLMFRKFVVCFDDQTPLQYFIRVKNMLKQMKTLSYILAIHPNVDMNVRPPMGSQFLGYLYREINHVTQIDNIMLLVFILKKCCHVYFKHLQKWIYYGLLDDPCHEMFVCFVDHYRTNTKYFFDKAYFVNKESVPGFFQGFEDQILQCGKYMMLLKAFKPTHPLFTIEYPPISVCLSFEDVQLLEQKCRLYSNMARAVCGERITVRETFAKRAESRRKFFEMASEKSKKNFQQWILERETMAIQQAAEKKTRLEELNQQLQEQHDRKVAERQASIELELKLLQECQEVEDKRLLQENIELKKRIEYFKELNTLINEKNHKIEDAKLQLITRTQRTDFDSCNREGEEIEEKVKSVYEDAYSSSSEFLDNVENSATKAKVLLATEKNCDNDIEIVSKGNNNNSDSQITSMKKSASDYFNSNELVSEFHKNRNKILGSNITDYFGSDSNLEVKSNKTLSEAQKIKLKVLQHEFGYEIPDHSAENNNIDRATKPDNPPELSELQQNRQKMMHGDTFAAFNKSHEKQNLKLDLNTERARIRRKVLESEFNITYLTVNNSTPMSTTSDSSIVYDKMEDVKNANVTKNELTIDVETAMLNKSFVVDLNTAAVIPQGTPQSALNTAGVIARESGFNFQKPVEEGKEILIDCPNGKIKSVKQIDDEEPYKRCEELVFSNFKCKPMTSFFSISPRKSSDQGPDNQKHSAKQTNLNNLSVITLTDFLQKSVIVPMQTHLSIVNNEILKIYLQDLDILSHFKSLRNYYFQMDGEFVSFICEGLISQLEQGSSPAELLNYQMLHSILENALGSRIIGNDKNAANLSFIVEDMPEKFDLSSPSVLSNLSLSYRVQWPLNLILNPESLEQYSNVFKYLVKVRRISWVLEDSYKMLKETVKRNGREMLLSPQYRRIQLSHHKFFQFVLTLKNHITANALQSSWKTFKDDLLTVQSIEDLYKKHTTYIKRVLFLCLLNRRSEGFYNTIENIFKVLLRFHGNLKARQWKRKPGDEHFTHSRYEKLLIDEQEFEKFIKYTIYLGNKIVRHGYQKEIGEFINLINFNQYYVVNN